MQELISPAQSETLIGILATVLLFGCAAWGWKAMGPRGILLGLLGPLVFGLWQFHKWITRYDPQTGYFGLDKVWVLLLEMALFVVMGVVLGVLIKKLVSRNEANVASQNEVNAA